MVKMWTATLWPSPTTKSVTFSHSKSLGVSWDLSAMASMMTQRSMRLTIVILYIIIAEWVRRVFCKVVISEHDALVLSLSV